MKVVHHRERVEARPLSRLRRRHDALEQVLASILAPEVRDV